jgi:hypothetical protein
MAEITNLANWGLSSDTFTTAKTSSGPATIFVYSAHGRVVATIEPAETWPSMWRVRLPKRRPSDMVNRARAREAAVSLVLANLNYEDTPADAPPMRSFARPLSVARST